MFDLKHHKSFSEIVKFKFQGIVQKPNKETKSADFQGQTAANVIQLKESLGPLL